MLVFVSDNGGMVKNGGNNYPLRGEKTTQWEGGYRVPAFVHSALLPPSMVGAKYAHVFQVTDWVPTLVIGALGVGDDLTSDGSVIDGVSHWEQFMGRNGTAPRDEVLHDIYYLKDVAREKVQYSYWLTAAIRKGSWKLITHQAYCDVCDTSTAHCNCVGNTTDFLYNLADDPYESHNLLHNGDAQVAKAELLARLEYHYEHTLEAARYRSKDHKASKIFAANGGFVTEWARPEEPGDIKYPKPDLTQITWLENHDPIVSGLNDDDPGSAVPGGDADRR